MKLENDIGVWEPNELVYSASDLPTYSYLVIEGQAQIVSPSGLRLSSIGYNELFGEASFILGKNRTVTAIAGENGLTARLIKSDHLIAKLKQDILHAGAGHCWEEAVDHLCEHGPSLVKNILLDTLQAKFDKSGDKLKRVTEGAHSDSRVIYNQDKTGLSIHKSALKYLQRWIMWKF